MRPLTKGIATLVVASLALFASACNKGPADAALKAADQALAAAKPEIEKYVPEELAAAHLRRRRRRGRSSTRATTPRP